MKKIEDVFGLRDKEQLVQCPGSGLLDISGVLTGADRTILAIGYGWLCDEIDWDDPG